MAHATHTTASSDQLSLTFAALADPVRLRLLSLVAAHADREACVCDLNNAFDLSQPTISHHMKVLHEAGIGKQAIREAIYGWLTNPHGDLLPAYIKAPENVAIAVVRGTGLAQTWFFCPFHSSNPVTRAIN